MRRLAFILSSFTVATTTTTAVTDSKSSSFLMTLALFSLAGIPPFAGMFSKFFVFMAGVQNGDPMAYAVVFIALAVCTAGIALFGVVSCIYEWIAAAGL